MTLVEDEAVGMGRREWIQEAETWDMTTGFGGEVRAV